MIHPLQITELFESHAATLTLLARFWCVDPEDAVQSAFVELAHLKELPRNPRAWLYTTTRRKALNIARRESRHGKHSKAASLEKPTWFVAAGPEPAWDPAELKVALDNLDEETRQLVVARVWGELGFEELAEMMDCSVSTAFRRYQSALEKLKALLESGP